MSLQVWLPLNGNLDNQGLSNVTVTNNGATVDNNGKIGKCYYLAGASTSYIDTGYKTALGTSDFTISLWLKLPTITSGSYFAICTSKTSGAASVGCGIYWNYTQKKFLWSTADGSGATEIFMATAVDNIVYDKWIHLVMVRNSSDSKLGYFYINGTRYELASVPAIRNIAIGTNMLLGKVSNNNYYVKGYYNDFRIYDHALSAKEVKELAKGLVLHYPLSDKCLQQMNNCYSNPRFEEGNVGWGVWGDSNAAGSSGFTTDKQWIYRKDQTYARWVANASTATSHYILYQQPTFAGGYRSLCCICKEEHGYEITNEIMHPGWNATVGPKEKKFDKIISLGDGFYYCECNGLQQDGSNDLVAFAINPGYKIYFSEAYLENDRKLCSDILFQTTTMYDVSGYNYHGTASIDLIASEDTARYKYCLQFNGTSSTIEAPALPTSTSTISIWVKTSWATWTDSGYCLVVHDLQSGLGIGFASDNRLICYVGSSVGGEGSCVLTTNLYKANVWNHIVVVKTGANTRSVYINGQLAPAGSNNFWGGSSNKLYISGRYYSTYKDYFNGELSDFRAYATALSAEDVAELYNTAASLANNGTLFAYDFVEV